MLYKRLPEILCHISSSEHPCSGHHGLFAKSYIPPKSFIMNYTGYLILDSDCPDSDYALHLYNNISVDATKGGNAARFINDFRGIQDRPNVAFDIYKDAQGLIQMGVWTLNVSIEKGQEILVSYGKQFWKSRGIHVSGPEWDPSWDDDSSDEFEQIIENT